MSSQDYNEAIHLDPQLALAYNNRGNAYKDLGQYQKAIQDYNEAIHFDPQAAIAYENRGVAYTFLGKDTEAQQDIERAVELGYDRAILEVSIREAKRQR